MGRGNRRQRPRQPGGGPLRGPRRSRRLVHQRRQRRHRSDSLSDVALRCHHRCAGAAPCPGWPFPRGRDQVLAAGETEVCGLLDLAEASLARDAANEQRQRSPWFHVANLAFNLGRDPVSGLGLSPLGRRSDQRHRRRRRRRGHHFHPALRHHRGSRAYRQGLPSLPERTGTVPDAPADEADVAGRLRAMRTS